MRVLAAAAPIVMAALAAAAACNGAGSGARDAGDSVDGIDSGTGNDDGSDLDAPTGSDDTVAPRVVSSSPAHGEDGVYPARLFGGTVPRVRIVIRFDEAMDAARDAIAYAALGGAPTEIAGVWSEDATELRVEIVGAALAGQRPLADLTTYELDLSSLRDLGGNAVDPGAGLDGGRLRFSTGVYDPLLNHACGHVQLGPFASATASATRSPGAARTDVGHTRYTVALPALGGAHAGYTRIRAASDATWHLFLDGDGGGDPVGLESESGEPRPVELGAAPDACDGIRQRATFRVAALDQAVLRFGPQASPEIRFIVEIVPE